MDAPAMKPMFECILFLGTLVASLASNSLAHGGESVVWYRQPAQLWHEALPVGNGRIGAMVFGGAEHERLQLNEQTIWSGNRSDYDRVGAYEHLPEVRRLLFAGEHAEADALVKKEILGDRPLGSYQPLGDLTLRFHADGAVSDYRRELDMSRAVATVRYRQGDAVFTREAFVSFPAKVLVVRLTCDKPGRVSFTAALDRIAAAKTEAAGDDVVLRGRADDGEPTAGTRFLGQLRVVNDGGRRAVVDKALVVTGADSALVLFSAATDFDGAVGWQDAPQSALDRAAEMSYDRLLAEHLADYQPYFRRVDIEVGDGPEQLPTDERLDLVKGGAGDPGMVELHFNYGRYLLISSSRPGGLPANLQGLWNHELNAPWFGGWHLDPNAMMIYWHAETLNLSDLHEPFFDLIDRLRVNGRKTARDVYNARGFTAAHRTNANFFTSPVKGFTVWPMGAGWAVQNMWEHYRFTQDREFLKTRACPTIREAAEFFCDWLVEDPETGKLVSGPSISPENSFVLPDGSFSQVCMGPTLDQLLIAEVFDNTLEAAGILGIEDDTIREIRVKRARLAGPKIGSDGRLLEWSKEYEEREPAHRHVSHLFGVYPGCSMTPRRTPDLAEAARKSLVARITGDQVKKVNISDASSVGWSLAWNACLWARLGDGEQAHDTAMNLLRRCTFPNLMDFHPRANTPGVFQIDGNMTTPAAVAEMLVQSHDGAIDLLPALPKAWPAGSVRGLRARGNVEVDLAWAGGRLQSATLHPGNDGALAIRHADKDASLVATAGQPLKVNADLDVIP
jgi:alpha-L-fucosidase 2